MNSLGRARVEARARARLRPGRNFRRGSGSDLTRGAFAPQGRRAARLARAGTHRSFRRISAGDRPRGCRTSTKRRSASCIRNEVQAPVARNTRSAARRAPARSCSASGSWRSRSRRSASPRPVIRCAKAGATAPRQRDRDRQQHQVLDGTEGRLLDPSVQPVRSAAAARLRLPLAGRRLPRDAHPQNPCIRANNLSRGLAFEFNARSATSSARSPQAPAATRRSRSRRTRRAWRQA